MRHIHLHVDNPEIHPGIVSDVLYPYPADSYTGQLGFVHLRFVDKIPVHIDYYVPPWTDILVDTSILLLQYTLVNMKIR